PASAYPPAQLRAALDRVHEQVLRELPALDEAELDRPVPHPHPFAKTKLLALLWCAHHEMLHAGQIGLLRRHLGYPPVWRGDSQWSTSTRKTLLTTVLAAIKLLSKPSVCAAILTEYLFPCFRGLPMHRRTVTWRDVVLGLLALVPSAK